MATSHYRIYPEAYKQYEVGSERFDLPKQLIYSDANGLPGLPGTSSALYTHINGSTKANGFFKMYGVRPHYFQTQMVNAARDIIPLASKLPISGKVPTIVETTNSADEGPGYGPFSNKGVPINQGTQTDLALPIPATRNYVPPPYAGPSAGDRNELVPPQMTSTQVEAIPQMTDSGDQASPQMLDNANQTDFVPESPTLDLSSEESSEESYGQFEQFREIRKLLETLLTRQNNTNALISHMDNAVTNNTRLIDEERANREPPAYPLQAAINDFTSQTRVMNNQLNRMRDEINRLNGNNQDLIDNVTALDRQLQSFMDDMQRTLQERLNEVRSVEMGNAVSEGHQFQVEPMSRNVGTSFWQRLQQIQNGISQTMEQLDERLGEAISPIVSAAVSAGGQVAASGLGMIEAGERRIISAVRQIASAPGSRRQSSDQTSMVQVGPSMTSPPSPNRRQRPLNERRRSLQLIDEAEFNLIWTALSSRARDLYSSFPDTLPPEDHVGPWRAPRGSYDPLGQPVIADELHDQGYYSTNMTGSDRRWYHPERRSGQMYNNRYGNRRRR